MEPLIWPILLLLVGLALVVAEVMVPSGGILGFLSFAAILTAVILSFHEGGKEVGLIFILVTLVLVPTLIAAGFRYWPYTPMGKRLLLDIPTSADVLPDSPELRALRDLVGKTGVAKSLMLPSGAVAIEGRTIDAVSEGMPIEAGQNVRVVAVQGNVVVVRPADEPAAPAKPDDVLGQSLESLGLDSFQEPLA